MHNERLFWTYEIIKDVREFLLNENTIERIYRTLVKLEVQTS